MALWRSKGARKDAVRGTQPIEVRKSDALLFTRAGVVAGSASPLVTGTSGWTYNVGKAGFVTIRSESDGAHVFGNDGVAATPAVAVAPGSGLSRIDVIWVRHPAVGENSDTTSEPVFGVTSGVASSTPVAPSLPAGALELARNTMTSAATSTSSAGNSIAQTAASATLRPATPTRPCGYITAGTQSGASGSWSRITWDGAANTMGDMTSSTGGLIAPVSGMYAVTVTVTWPSSTNGRRGACAGVGATVFPALLSSLGVPSTLGLTTQSATAIRYFDAGAVISGFQYQDSGSAMNGAYMSAWLVS